jgi:hypothetical protein
MRLAPVLRIVYVTWKRGELERRWVLWYQLPSQYVVAGDAVEEGMKAHEHGVVSGVVTAKNVDGTKQS